jgi:hypothetical protein
MSTYYHWLESLRRDAIRHRRERQAKLWLLRLCALLAVAAVVYEVVK